MNKQHEATGVGRRILYGFYTYGILRVGPLLASVLLVVYGGMPHHVTAIKKSVPKKPTTVAVVTTPKTTTKSTTPNKTKSKPAKPSTVSTPAVTQPTTTTTPKTTTKKHTTKVVTPSPSSSVNALKPTSGSSGSSSPSGGGSTYTPTVTYTSTNWSGYLADSGTFTAISGSWVAPADPTGNGTSTSADATWIGIGGVTTGDLIQVGTGNTVSSSGQVSTSAWYEMLPGASVTIPGVSVRPGDDITASLVEVSAGEWTITLTDETDGETFTDTVAYTSSNSSAEWVEEDPSYSAHGSAVPLDDFGSVTFDNAATTVSGTSDTLEETSPASITMVDGLGHDEGVPSTVTGNSFSVSWE